jgi:hypothetical protein
LQHIIIMSFFLELSKVIIPDELSSVDDDEEEEED